MDKWKVGGYIRIWIFIQIDYLICLSQVFWYSWQNLVEKAIAFLILQHILKSVLLSKGEIWRLFLRHRVFPPLRIFIFTIGAINLFIIFFFPVRCFPALYKSIYSLLLLPLTDVTRLRTNVIIPSPLNNIVYILILHHEPILATW